MREWWRGGSAILLLALALQLTVQLAAGDADQDEGAIMRRLRQEFHLMDAAWTDTWVRWHLNDTSHHCDWQYVACDNQRHVVQLWIRSTDTSPPMQHHSPGQPAQPLLPELAQLQWLRELAFDREYLQLPGSIPAAWGAPGAFPRLSSLQLSGASIGGPLLDIQPGALPLLSTLSLKFNHLQPAATLPPSWGSDPEVLPDLRTLTLQLPFEGPLPTEWARGFQQLTQITLSRAPFDYVDPRVWSNVPVPPASTPQRIQRPEAGAQSPAPTLPPEWAAGFPRLAVLTLGDIGATGALPQQWVSAGFPALQQLALSQNFLTGSLPEDLFKRRPKLALVNLGNNLFEGTIPDAWAIPGAVELNLAGNRLSGPAFPPAWIQDGSMPSLVTLRLDGNTGLTGTLPKRLPWPMLKVLDVSNTVVSGRISSSWCHFGAEPRLGQQRRTIVVINTTVDAALPPCMLKSPSRFIVQFEEQRFVNSEQQGSGRSPHLPHAWISALSSIPGLVLSLGLLTACLLLGKRLQHSASPLQQLLPGTQDRQVLLSVVQQRGSASLDSTSHASTNHTPSLSLPSTSQTSGSGRHRRLGAMLSAVLSDSSNGLELLPLRGLPPALAHRLDPASRSQAFAGSSRNAEQGAATAALPQLHRQELRAGAAGHPAGSDSGTDHPHSTVRVIPSSRKWGLATDSLQLPADEIQFITDDAGQLVVLGEGAHAVVWLAELSGVQVAVKAFELLPHVQSGSVWREAWLLGSCSHRCIVPLYGIAIKGQLLLLVMRLMEGGSLREEIAQSDSADTLPWPTLGLRLALDITDALVYLHNEAGIIHSDLKSGNILLTEDCHACLGDLGLSQVLGDKTCARAGFSYSHAAPEQLMGENPTAAADVYSLGIVLIELTTHTVVYKRGEWRLPHAPAECSAAVVSLTEQCVALDPSSRPTAAQVLQRLQAEAGGRKL